MTRIIALALSLLFIPLTSSAENLPEAPSRLSVPVDAVAIAASDILANHGHTSYFRYVWVPSGDPADCATMDLAVNIAMSRNPLPIRGVRLGENHVLRYDLESLIPDPDELKEVLEVWEKFNSDEPYFLVNSQNNKPIIVITQETVVETFDKPLGKVAVGTRLEFVRSHSDENEWWVVKHLGKEGFVLKDCGKKEEAGEDKVRTFGPHCGREAGALVLATESQVPLVRFDYFLRKILSSVDGGLYYEFRGIKKSPDKNVSDIDFLLKTFTLITEKDLEKLRTDPRKKVAMFRSGVTGKPRSVVLFQGAQGSLGVNQGIVAVTQDMADNDVDPAADPILNLVKHKFPGIELFVEMSNGHILYGLYTGDINGDGKYDPAEGEGELVASAPDTIAADFTVPAPHTRRIQSAISCIRCHSTKRGDIQPEGWLPMQNDVALLLKSRVDVFGERGDGGPKQETVAKLAGLYTGNLEKAVRLARDDLAEAVIRLTGEPGKKGQSVVTIQHQRIAKKYQEYWYDLVTPQVACREIGFEVKDDDAGRQLLLKLLPPLPADEIGVSPEDPRLAALKSGISINRLQWEAVYADAVYRSVQTLKQVVR